MLTNDEFKILMLNYNEQIKYFTKEIRKQREVLRNLRNERKMWEFKARSLCNHELFEEYEPRTDNVTKPS